MEKKKRRATNHLVAPMMAAIALATTIESTNSAIAEWCNVMDYIEGRITS